VAAVADPVVPAEGKRTDSAAELVAEAVPVVAGPAAGTHTGCSAVPAAVAEPAVEPVAVGQPVLAPGSAVAEAVPVVLEPVQTDRCQYQGSEDPDYRYKPVQADRSAELQPVEPRCSLG